MAFDLVKAYSTFDNALTEKASALPRNFNKARFLQNCMTVLSENKDLQACDINSVKRGILKGAFLGLDFFSKEAYLIKYGNSCQFQTDYKGETKLVKKYSIRPIKNIYAKLVREGDAFEETIVKGEASINFSPKPFNDGEIIGAFAVVSYEDGGMGYETMSAAEIEDVRRAYSKAPNSPAWKNSKGEMYKKTVLRRLCKTIEIDFESKEQQQTFEEASDFGFANNIKAETAANIEENANTIRFEDVDVIEADAEVVEAFKDGEMPSFLEE